MAHLCPNNCEACGDDISRAVLNDYIGGKWLCRSCGSKARDAEAERVTSLLRQAREMDRAMAVADGLSTTDSDTVKHIVDQLAAIAVAVIRRGRLHSEAKESAS